MGRQQATVMLLPKKDKCQITNDPRPCSTAACDEDRQNSALASDPGLRTSEKDTSAHNVIGEVLLSHCPVRHTTAFYSNSFSHFWDLYLKKHEHQHQQPQHAEGQIGRENAIV